MVYPYIYIYIHGISMVYPYTSPANARCFFDLNRDGRHASASSGGFTGDRRSPWGDGEFLKVMLVHILFILMVIKLYGYYMVNDLE